MGTTFRGCGGGGGGGHVDRSRRWHVAVIGSELKTGGNQTSITVRWTRLRSVCGQYPEGGRGPNRCAEQGRRRR